MADEQAWLRAETGGTKRALVISKPDILTALINKANHPLIIAGHEVTAPGLVGETLIACIRDMSSRNIPVVATAHTIKELRKRDISPAAAMGVMDIVQRLCDPDWKGLSDTGSYDLVLIAGISYSLCSVVLSGLKNGAPKTITLTLDPRYHPNATWSMPNKKGATWEELLHTVCRMLAE